MVIITSTIFKQFPEITFGFSTKHGLDRKPPFHFNLSLSVGDDPGIVWENREAFFNTLHLTTKEIAFQKQVHEDTVSIVTYPGFQGESDAIITKECNIGLAVSSADCGNIFLYDKKNSVIAGIHSGWRSTQKKILKKTIQIMKTQFNSDPECMYAYVGPSISQKNYEVGKEFADFFDAKYLIPRNDKFLLDITGINHYILLEEGIPEKNIELSGLCSYDENELLHSYRREGARSGRAYGVIAMRSNGEQ